MEPIKSLLVLSFLTMVTLSMCHPTATNGRFYRNDDAIMDYDGYQLIRIKPMNMEQITILKQLENEYEMDYWNPIVNNEHDQQPIMTIIDPQRLEFLSQLNQSNIEYDILIPENAEKISIGYSYEQRNIMGIKIVNNKQNNSSQIIFVECGIHAREWISPAYCIWLAGQLLTNKRLSSLNERYQFIIIPSLNVDGYVFTHTHQRLWRKTRSRQYGTNCIGADPNRNWAISWCQKGSSLDPCQDTYCGRGPFSEIEVRQMANFVHRYEGKIFAYFAIHSYSQLWMFPYGYTARRVDNYNQLRIASLAAVQSIRSLFGTQFKFGSIAEIIYSASGSSIDYVYDSLNVKNTFALELRDKGRYGFQLPNWQIIPTCVETLAGMRTAIDVLDGF
nr:zinc carboxypeptidase-like [Dermatophagoides farinae]